MKGILKLFILILFFLVNPLSVVAGTPRVHTITRGETLNSIAKKYDVSFSEILSLNPNINKTPWKIGNKILIPERKINAKSPQNMGVKNIASKNNLPINVKTKIVIPSNQKIYKPLTSNALPKKIVVKNPVNEKKVIRQVSNPPKSISNSNIGSSNSTKKRGTLSVTLGDTTQKYKGNLPFPLKQDAKMSSNFGARWGSYHEGLDIPAKKNTSIYATHDGVVVYSSNWMRGYGNMIAIETDGIMTVYAHNNANIVKRGDRVSKGDRIGYVGSTGHSTGNHLHFETRIKANKKWYAVNPRFFLFGEK